MEGKIVVNKDKSEERINQLYSDIVERAKKEASNGFSSFEMILPGTYMECQEATFKAEKFGIRVCERGFSSFGKGSEAFCKIQFKIIEQ